MKRKRILRGLTGWLMLLSLAGCAGHGTSTNPNPPAPGAHVAPTAPEKPTQPPERPSGPFSVYVGIGDWERNQAGHVLLFDLDSETAALTQRQSIRAGGLSTFLAFAPNKQTLYAADERTFDLYSFSIDTATGALAPLNQVAGQGNPAHLSVDATGSTLFAVYFNQGKSESFAVLEGGAIGPSANAVDSGTHSHALELDRSNRYAFVPARGSDWIAQYRFDADSRKLTPNPDARKFTVAQEKGDGPRHVAFHPNGRWLYLVNELSLTVTPHTFDANTGLLTKSGPRVSALAPGQVAPEGASAADIHVHPNGKFLYSSNRLGPDSSVAIFSLDQTTGAPTLLETQSTHGQTPRNFEIVPTGKHLLVANQDSKNIAAFSIDEQTGKLSFLRLTDTAERPYFVGVVEFSR